MEIYRIRNTGVSQWGTTLLGDSLASLDFSNVSQLPLPTDSSGIDAFVALKNALHQTADTVFVFCIETLSFSHNDLQSMQACAENNFLTKFSLCHDDTLKADEHTLYAHYWQFVILLSQLLWTKQSLAEWLASCETEHIENIEDMTLSLQLFVEKKATDLGKNMKLHCVFPQTPHDQEEQVKNSLQNGDAKAALKVLENLECQVGRTSPQISLWKAYAKTQLYRFHEAQIHATTAADGGFSVEVKQLQNELDVLQKKYPPSFFELREALSTIEGYLSSEQQEYLYSRVRSLPDNAQILEVGSFCGLSTAIMAFACVGTNKKVYCIDTFFGNDGAMGRSVPFFDIWRTNLKRYDLLQYVLPFHGYSADVLREHADFPEFDFIFLDASHEYIHIAQDIQLAYPRLKVGGYMALHDVELGWPGPWRAWREYQHLLHDRHHVGSLAGGQKRSMGMAPRSLPWQGYGKEYALSLSEAQSENISFTRLLMQSLPAHIHGTSSQWQVQTQMLKTLPGWIKDEIYTLLQKDAAEDPALLYWKMHLNLQNVS